MILYEPTPPNQGGPKTIGLPPVKPARTGTPKSTARRSRSHIRSSSLVLDWWGFWSFNSSARVGPSPSPAAFRPTLAAQHGANFRWERDLAVWPLISGGAVIGETNAASIPVPGKKAGRRAPRIHLTT